MSNKLKLNVKNVILGCHNFGDILATNRIHSKIPRLVAPSAIDHTKSSKPDLYYKQDYLRRNALNHTESVLPRVLDSTSLKRITSKLPIPNKRICEIHTGRISNPGGLLPWESPIEIKKNLQSALPAPKIHKDGCELPLPPCPPTAKGPKYPTKLKCYPRKLKKTNLTKITPKTLLYNCRFYSANRHQPSASLNPFKPKFCKIKRELRCGAKPCKPTTKKSGCSPSIDTPGGDPCAGIPKAPKECYQTPGKGARSGGFKKEGPVCPDNPCGK